MADDGFLSFLVLLITILACVPGSLLIPVIGIAVGRRWLRRRRRPTGMEVGS